MISTADFSSLPDRKKLQQICKAISVMDLIISPEWEFRYYSYQSQWAEGEEFFEMRDGSGDQMMILFQKDGCVINGMSHEYYPKDKDKLTKGLPEIYDEFIFGEPVLSIGTTFCLWITANTTWNIGEVEDFEDGSSESLKIFDGNPQTYIDWAKEYYEDDFLVDQKTFEIVSNIYQGKVLTKSMILSIVDNVDDWDKLKADLEEAGYPFKGL